MSSQRTRSPRNTGPSTQERTIRVEYDATRLNESTVEKLLRSAGFDVKERLALV